MPPLPVLQWGQQGSVEPVRLDLNPDSASITFTIGLTFFLKLQWPYLENKGPLWSLIHFTVEKSLWNNVQEALSMVSIT